MNLLKISWPASPRKLKPPFLFLRVPTTSAFWATLPLLTFLNPKSQVLNQALMSKKTAKESWAPSFQFFFRLFLFSLFSFFLLRFLSQSPSRTISFSLSDSPSASATSSLSFDPTILPNEELLTQKLDSSPLFQQVKNSSEGYWKILQVKTKELQSFLLDQINQKYKDFKKSIITSVYQDLINSVDRSP